jgi:hypothetical protein
MDARRRAIKDMVARVRDEDLHEVENFVLDLLPAEEDEFLCDPDVVDAAMELERSMRLRSTPPSGGVQ